MKNWFDYFFGGREKPSEHPVPNFRKSPEKDAAARAKGAATLRAKSAARKAAQKSHLVQS